MRATVSLNMMNVGMQIMKNDKNMDMDMIYKRTNYAEKNIYFR